MTRVLEGTWEEIAAHKEEWNGKRLRVAIEVLDAAGGSGQDAGLSVADLLGDIIGSVSGLPADLGANHKKYFAQAMDEKQQRDREKQTRKAQ